MLEGWKKKIGSGGGGMPDSNVRWLEIQHTPLPNLMVNARNTLICYGYVGSNSRARAC